MKRILIIVSSLFLFALYASAQSKVYCELLGTQKFLSTKVTVSVDFGQERKFFGDNRMVSGAGASNVYHWLLSKYVGEGGDQNAIRTKQILYDEERAAAAKSQGESATESGNLLE